MSENSETISEKRESGQYLAISIMAGENLKITNIGSTPYYFYAVEFK